MFRIEFLKLTDHPQLGKIEINFSEPTEYNKVEKPYTSVIIGANGTGKSFILRTIADIFRQFKAYSLSDKKEFTLPFDIHLRYRFYHNTYEIITRRMEAFTRRGMRREYLFYKNRPLEDDILTEDQLFGEKNNNYEVLHKELEYPEKLLVNSIIQTDRFIQQSSSRSDFYQYLGVRSTSSTTSTKSSVRRTIRHIFNATTESKDFVKKLKDLLLFLEFQESFQVVYKTKINKLFFSKNLTKESFRKYFENWWEEDFEFTRRKKENPLWSIPYYNQHFKGNELMTDRLIDYLNKIPLDGSKFHNKPNSSSKIIVINLFDSNIDEEELNLLRHLENLDIINLEGVRVQKNTKELSINDISSGEYHLLISLIGMFANIEKDSLILIDEPEISLHPNWQMRYITFLKKVFANFSSCHFVLTTHSHFLVSDLEGESSAVIELIRDVETNELSARLLEGEDTFGWSAEDVLYRVFSVRTTRNFFMEIELRELLHLISAKSNEKKKMEEIVGRLDRVKLSQNDPLNIILEKAKTYIGKL